MSYEPDGAVAVAGDRIAGVGTTTEVVAPFQAAEQVSGSGCALLPAMVDAHMHTPLAIVRGVAQDVAHWMQRALAPYSRHLSREASLAGSRLAAVEALR